MNLEHYWMPFTANRAFKNRPRLLEHACGMHYWTNDGRRLLDAAAGLWCVNAGHARAEIGQAIARQFSEMDYAPPFQVGHGLAFELAERLGSIAPRDAVRTLDRIFFTCSGSDAVDTALKMALAYHRANGEASRTRLIGRERSYHGAGFGGMSVGGIVTNRRSFQTLPGIDHLPHRHETNTAASCGGIGATSAKDLERLVQLHGAENIAALIVEPVAGSTGVFGPPQGYLGTLRELCDRHGILLIFDEVITGFGRIGKPFAADFFDVVPDIMTTAKGLTNGSMPMGAVFAGRHIHDAIMENGSFIEFPHGYTYSAHPLACAAALATLRIYESEGLLTRAENLSDRWVRSISSLGSLADVEAVRTIGLMAGIDLRAGTAAAGARGYRLFDRCFEAGLLVRVTGDTVALSPPIIIDEAQIEEVCNLLGDTILALEDEREEV